MSNEVRKIVNKSLSGDLFTIFFKVRKRKNRKQNKINDEGQNRVFA